LRIFNPKSAIRLKGDQMKKWWLALIPFVGALSGIGIWVGGTRSAPPVLKQAEQVRAVTAPAVPSLADEARAVFKAKCAGCHGPDLEKPQGRFGYVLDLAKIAANPEMVVPGRLAESELWALVSHNEMPPPDSPRGPLTPAQKEAIKKWIAAGAPE
jgi:mono/diheme cytochrome c family protein